MASKVHLGGPCQTEQIYSHQHVSAQMLTAQLGWQNVKAVLSSMHLEISVSRTHSLLAKLCDPHNKDYSELHELSYQSGEKKNG